MIPEYIQKTESYSFYSGNSLIHQDTHVGVDYEKICHLDLRPYIKDIIYDSYKNKIWISRDSKLAIWFSLL